MVVVVVVVEIALRSVSIFFERERKRREEKRVVGCYSQSLSGSQCPNPFNFF